MITAVKIFECRNSAQTEKYMMYVDGEFWYHDTDKIMGGGWEW